MLRRGDVQHSGSGKQGCTPWADLGVLMCPESTTSSWAWWWTCSQDSQNPLCWQEGCRGCGAVAVGSPGPSVAVPQEPCWAHVQSMAPQRTLLLDQIKLAVLNLFQLTTTWLKVPGDTALEDTEAQLDTVSTPSWWGWRGHSHILEGCGKQDPCLHRCCFACRTWLPSAMSFAPSSWSHVSDACLLPPA